MGLGDFHRHRRLASAFAFVGVLLYAALIPGHMVSQATATIGIPAAFDIDCHSGVEPAQKPGAPSEPYSPYKNCPFCTGYAAFMTALAGECDTAVLDAERIYPVFAAFNDGLAKRSILRPHNRGPPLELLTS